jgi:hypothetical protein
MEPLSFSEKLHSGRNRLFWRIRAALKFRAGRYREAGAAKIQVTGEAAGLERRYGLAPLKLKLSEDTYLKNIATLAMLESQLAPILATLPSAIEVLEPGTQDFSRLPAFDAFFRAKKITAAITALELDAFPLLQGFHSRADKAAYFQALLTDTSRHRFLAVDFFRWRKRYDCILCFYPFVSVNPALAWGIPAEFGNASAWLESFVANLKPNGLLLVVHQGRWEEEAFDEERKKFPLDLLSRAEMKYAFYPLPHPACASVYRLR